ncbi:MAG: glycosyltransferase family 39 protein [Chloroflexota bacterium]
MLTAPRYHWSWMVWLLLLVTFLGLRGMSARTLSFDEYWSLYDAGVGRYGPLSPAEVWNRVANEDPWQAPGYSLILSGWNAVLGWTEFTSRMLSLSAGLLAVAGIYRLGRDAISPLGGLGAALTLGLSVFFTVYLRELRGYTLYVAFTILTVWGYWQLIAGHRKRYAERYAAIWFFAGMLGLFYIHYFSVFTAIAIAAYHLLFVPKNRRWWRPVLLMGVAFLLFLPWFGVAYAITAKNNLHQEVRRAIAVDSRTVTQFILYIFSNGSVALLAVVGVYSLRFRQRITGLAWFWAIGFLVIGLLINQVWGVVAHIRYLFGLWPALALIAALGIDRLAWSGLRPAVLFSVWIVACLWNTYDPAFIKLFDNSWDRLPWNVFAQTLAPHVQKEDKVIFLLPYPGVYDMYRPSLGHYTQDLPGEYLMLGAPGRPVVSDTYEQRAHELTQSRQRLWVGYDPSQDTDSAAFDRVLVNTHILCNRYAETPLLNLSVYAPLPDPAHNVRLHFGTDIDLTLLVDLPQVAGHSLSVMIGSSAKANVPANTYSIGLQVQDANGQLVAQKDYGLPVTEFACQDNEIVLDKLPPGHYTLMAVVYAWQTGERLPAQNMTIGAQGDRLPLGTFSIAAAS